MGSSNSPDSNDSAGGAGSTPLSLLSHVVHMQKELEQQRAQLEAMQQQLEHTSNRCGEGDGLGAFSAVA